MTSNAITQAMEQAAPFNAPIPLSNRTPPECPTDVLPGALGEMARAVSRTTETPLELALSMGLATVSAACQKKFEIEVEPDYAEPMNVWLMASLESGNRKTAVAQHMTAPLIEWESDTLEAAKQEIKRSQSDRQNEEARLKRLRCKYASQKVVNLDEIRNEIRQLEDNLTFVPQAPRVLAQDITPEQLGRVLADNGERIAIISDEGGIFEILAGRYSNGIPNLDVFLQAHAGAIVRVDRASRDPVYLNAPALTMGLSPQPSVLQSLVQHPEFRGRGLLSRFLYCLPDSNLGFRKLEIVPIPTTTKQEYAALIKRLLNFSPPRSKNGKPEPHRLRLTEAAHAEWKIFQRIVERRMRPDEKFEHLKDWAGKLPGAAARIAGLLHCVQLQEPDKSDVNKETMDNAVQLAAWFSEHARIAFDLMGADPEMEAARKVWHWIERNRHKQFTARDCFNALRGTFRRMEAIEPSFRILKERFYLSETEREKVAGRPSRVLVVHPALTVGW